MSTSSCPPNYGGSSCPFFSPFAGSVNAPFSPMMMATMTPPKNKILKWKEERLFSTRGRHWDFEGIPQSQSSKKKRFVGGNMILSGDAWSFAYILLMTDFDESIQFPSLPAYDMNLHIARLSQLGNPIEWTSNYYDFNPHTPSLKADVLPEMGFSATRKRLIHSHVCGTKENSDDNNDNKQYQYDGKRSEHEL